MKRVMAEPEICFFGSFDSTFPRNYLLIRGFEEIGKKVQICHEPLWEDTRFKHKEAGSIFYPFKMVVRLLTTFGTLAKKFSRIRNVSFFVVGYPGYFDVIFLRLLLLIKHRRAKIIYVPCISLYDTLIGDRKLFSNWDPRAILAFLLDKLSLNLSDLILSDTDAYSRFFFQTFGVKEHHMRRLFVGADNKVFYPRESSQVNDDNEFNVLFFGDFIPLHGIDSILLAAKQLKGKNLAINLHGKGQLYDEIQKKIHDLGLEGCPVNLDTRSNRSYVSDLLTEADLVLGIFGESTKARNTLPNKVFISLAAGRPLITAGTPAAHELLTHGDTAYLTMPGDSDSLAKGILELKENKQLLDRIATNGYKLFQERCSPAVLAQEMSAYLEEFQTGDIKR